MSITTNISKWKRHEDKRFGAFAASLAIAEMDPNAREDLISYLRAFNAAQAAGDKQEQEYLIKAVLEVFQVDGGDGGSDIDDWDAEVRSTPRGRRAAKELNRETERFFNVYRRLKAQRGLTTIRKVAQAAGISPTTVQAIEKQKVKPQFKTIQALARAFRVDPAAFDKEEQ